MKELDLYKVFAQYRDPMNPYGAVKGRKYTITHSDLTADLFVFIAGEYAEDKITRMRDEVRLDWQEDYKGPLLYGSVLVDGYGVAGSSALRNQIFYREMPTALQALRQADRFLFERYVDLDSAPVIIEFVSAIPEYDKTYDFGRIGDYKIT
ncbi:MAG: staygreen family protein [Bacillota bacterium]|nr:staygreen family protein [Bacillota bacterium]